MNTKLKTILLWIAYIAVCVCAAAMPIAERGIRAKLIGKEERDEFNDTFSDWDHYNNSRI